MIDFTSNFQQDYSIDSTIEQMWYSFCNQLDLMEMVPTKPKCLNSHKPWINRKLMQLRRQKQRSYNRARSTNQHSDWAHFKELKRRMQRECCNSYSKYMSTIINESYEKGKKKKLFSLIKSPRTDYCGASTLQKDGVQYNENQDKANILNEYFSTIFTSSEHTHPSLGPSLYSTMPDLEISQAGVSHLLSELDPS